MKFFSFWKGRKQDMKFFYSGINTISVNMDRQAFQGKNAAAEQERRSQVEIVGEQGNISKESIGTIFCPAYRFIMTSFTCSIFLYLFECGVNNISRLL